MNGTTNRLFSLDKLRSFKPSLHFRKNEAEELVSNLEGHLRSLEKNASEVEITFVDFGKLFLTQVGINDKLIGLGEELTKSSSGSASYCTYLSQAIDLLQANLNFLSDCSAQTQTLIPKLESYLAIINQIRKGEANLQSMLIPLQVIERLFRIESASLPHEFQEAFHSVTKEISNLHSQMRKTLVAQFRALDSTSELTLKTIRSLREHSEKLTSQVAHSQEKLSKTLSILSDKINSWQSRNEQLAQQSESIAATTTEIMTSLQFQDVLRQKTDHIKSALEDIKKTVSDEEQSKAEKFTNIRLITQIELGQLNAIESGQSEASQNISSSARRILHTLDEIETNSLCSEHLESHLSEQETITKSTFAEIADSNELATLATKGINEVYERMLAFEGTATNVTGTLETITHDIRLIALNAQVKAAQIGNGTGLEILAENTCEISDRTNKYTSQVGAQLEEFILSLKSVLEDCQKIKAEATLYIDENGSKSDGLLSLLSSEFESNKSALRETAHCLLNCRSNANHMIDKAAFDNLTNADFSELKQQLEKAHEYASKKGPSAEGYDMDQSTTLQRIYENYTMDSERQILSQALDRAPNHQPTTEENDVELF